MNKEKILEMKPGSELNELVAERVMGECYHQYYKDGEDSIFCRKCKESRFYHQNSQSYSTDVSAAWRVLERIDGACDIKKRYRPHPDDPPCSGGRATYQVKLFLSDYDPYEDALINKRMITSPWCWTIPEAICKAALYEAHLKGEG